MRSLVEFILRSGDLDNRKSGKAEREAMQAGSRLHRKIQRRMGCSYQAEVSLKLEVPMQDFDCIVEGRADGIFEEDGLVTIDEIKGVYRELDLLQEPVGVHLAQAKCYAYLYAIQNGRKTMRVQMTYCNLESEATKYFHETYEVAELEIWFTSRQIIIELPKILLNMALRKMVLI